MNTIFLAFLALAWLDLADGFLGRPVARAVQNRKPTLSCSAAVVEDPLLAPYATAKGGVEVAAVAFERLFAFKPFLRVAATGARSMIVERADRLGVGWYERVGEMQRNMDKLEARYQSLLNPQVVTPDYYYAPFHAYEKGNLCWEASFEVEPSAISVHSHLFAPKGEFERGGDDRLRSNFHSRMLEMLQDWRPRDVVDIGCSTGLSTLKLASTFPSARITALDLSPHMLAVGQYKLAEAADKSLEQRVSYLHAAGEATGLPDSSADLVSICLVSHELPAGAAREIFREAARVLRPGGAISFMDMNPLAEAFQRLANNPFAFAAFKSTEPYLLEYMHLDLAAELRAAGFGKIDARANSPRHRTVVAWVEK